MTPRNRLILTIAGVVVVLLLGYFFFLRPQQARLADVNDEIDTAETQTVELTSTLNRLQDLAENAPELRAQLDEVRELVPPEDEVANFIFQVQEAADQSGVGFLQITPTLPRPPLEGAALAEVGVQIRSRGGYFAIQDFIRRLYDLDRAVRMDSLQLAGSAETTEGQAAGRVEMTSGVRIFFELPPQPAVAVDPATGAVPEASPSPQE